jgi:hypothetical protein
VLRGTAERCRYMPTLGAHQGTSAVAVLSSQSAALRCLI